MTRERIEFGELRIGARARANLNTVCDTNWASSGPMVEEFERRWSLLFNYKYSIATSSGTDAVLNACLSLYDNSAISGQDIILPALGFIATANAVRAAGFTPRFVDVKKETLNMDTRLLPMVIGETTAAILPVHTMGRMCNMKAIKTYAGKTIIIEDACEAHGAKRDGKFVGELSDMVCFSFYIAHIICSGEGGMISTPHQNIRDTIYSTKCHGRSGIYFDHPRYGLNSKMNDLEASLGLEGIDNFWSTFSTRRGTVKTIHTALDKYSDKVWFSEEDENMINCPHAFSITIREPGKRDYLTTELDKADIHWKRNFGCIPTQHTAFAYLGYEKGMFPNAEHIGDNGIHIGVHQYLSNNDIERIIAALDKGLSNI